MFILGFITCYLLGGIWSAYLACRHDRAAGIHTPTVGLEWVGLLVFVILWPWFWLVVCDDHVEELHDDY